MWLSKSVGSISGRLFIVVGFFVLLAAVGGGLVWTALQDVRDRAVLTESVRVKQLMQAASLEIDVTRVSLQLRHSMLARTPAERQTALDDIAAKRKQIDATVQAYRDQLFTDEGRKRFAPLPGLIQAFWSKGEVNLALIGQDRMPEAFAYLVDDVIPARNALLAALNDTKIYQEESLRKDIDAIEAGVNSSRLVFIGVCGLLIVSLGLFSWWLSHTLRSRVRTTQQVAERVRDGDLTADVQLDVHDEFEPLLRAMADMQTSLQRVVSGVRQGADSVATASAELAQGNQDLSTRTEDQASALQLTSRTMAQLGQTVRANADNAQQANQMSTEAARVAQQGGAVVGQVVQTMEGISESSRRIADIISTIDGIAFQTNILALNAAVEAARAGEQGRGFAVVASEVRSLAQRSAEAAREIKGLIHTSAERVEQGSALVRSAGDTMQGIVQAIDKVNLIMQDISAASQEQSAGIGQVERAIEQMENSTQQNAALVEESAAAATAMRSQAQSLVQAVAAFRMKEASKQGLRSERDAMLALR